MMRFALVLALSLSAPLPGLAAVRGITFPVISDWVMWRVRVSDRPEGDVTVRLNDLAQVTEAQAQAAGASACRLLGRDFVAATAPETGLDTWTWRGACQ